MPSPEVPRRANAMTIDVEDYFHVEAFKHVIARGDWDQFSRRVDQSTDRILSLLDETDTRATFFVLGWVAKRTPGLVRRIAEAGHEIASHGSEHERADKQSVEVFAKDVADAKALLEDISGARVRGYRAPTFSIGPQNWWAYDALTKAGYAYSSSVYPVRHDLYGNPDAPREPFHPIDGPLVEIPLTTVRLLGRNLPCAGGGYFRLLPYRLWRRGLRRVNQVEGKPGIFYCHPWEFDTGQPRVAGAGFRSSFRHYLNIGATAGRFAALLRDFSWDRMDAVFPERAA